jgi:hypothetical protein
MRDVSSVLSIAIVDCDLRLARKCECGWVFVGVRVVIATAYDVLDFSKHKGWCSTKVWPNVLGQLRAH